AATRRLGRDLRNLPGRTAMADLEDTPVSEIMTTEVLTLHGNATLAEGIATLRDYGVGGAPVVDEVGDCKGVFSLTDVARRDTEVEEGESPHAASYFNFGVTEKLSLETEDYDPELFDRETVGDWMSPEIKSVTPTTPVTRAARIMVEEGIHRL